jgi:hypothetical protein
VLRPSPHKDMRKATFLRRMHKHGASHAVAMPLIQAVGDDGTGRRGAKPVYFKFIILS